MIDEEESISHKSIQKGEGINPLEIRGSKSPQNRRRFSSRFQHKSTSSLSGNLVSSYFLRLLLHQQTMFATKFAVGSFRNTAASSRSAWRAFSNTAATFADQYDVVVVGTFPCIPCASPGGFVSCNGFSSPFLSLSQKAVGLVATSLPSNRHKWA